MNNVESYNFELPESLIAQTPLENRDHSRMLVLNREDNTIEHKCFADLIDYLKPNDVLVLNESRVIPARLIGVKEGTGASIEVLLLKELTDNQWECLCKPGKRVKVGTTILFGNNELKMECLDKREDGIFLFRLIYEGVLLEVLEKLGTMPLPPYIKTQLDNQERYQTVYSRIQGSAAAPTAGLHFTKELLDKIKAKGVQIAYLTLHVGLGTFKPVVVEDINDHKMHSEYYEITPKNVQIILDAQSSGGKVFSVGTTTTRTLETIMSKFGKLIPAHGYTDIFIYPGYQFKIVDHQLTNFHLPKSTLMMLISAFASRDQILNAYNEAIKQEYRFFSFGDSMLIL